MIFFELLYWNVFVCTKVCFLKPLLQTKLHTIKPYPQLSVFGSDGKWRILRKSKNIFGRTSFSMIIVYTHTQRKSNGYARKQERTVFHHVISFAEHQFDQYLEVELESLSPLLKNLRHPVPHMLRRDFWRFNDLFKL